MRLWTELEFAFLHANPLMAVADLADRIGRSVGAVEAVRWGVHEWHGDGNVSALNRMMLAYLASHRSQSVCSDCGAAV